MRTTKINNGRQKLRKEIEHKYIIIIYNLMTFFTYFFKKIIFFFLKLGEGVCWYTLDEIFY